MLKKLSFIATALTLVGFSSASSQSVIDDLLIPDDDELVLGVVGVIMPEVVRVWPDLTSLSMTVADVSFGAIATPATINYVNNISADISVAVSSPTPGVNFYIWDTGSSENVGLTAANAVIRQKNNFVAPEGALSWVWGEGDTSLSTAAKPLRSVVPSNVVNSFVVIYGANSGSSGLLSADTYSFTVTYTIAGTD
jgi:hypothetical protein